jgi:hypothetical protein
MQCIIHHCGIPQAFQLFYDKNCKICISALVTPKHNQLVCIWTSAKNSVSFITYKYNNTNPSVAFE